MAIARTRISDISREIIPDGTGARIRVWPTDKTKDRYVLDLTDEEYGKLVEGAKPVPNRKSKKGS